LLRKVNDFFRYAQVLLLLLQIFRNFFAFGVFNIK
jgi:hypothetical protein